MNQTRRFKHSAAIRTLLGIAAILVLLVGMVGCSATNQQSQKAQPAAASSQESASGYPAAYQVQFEQEWKMNKDFKGYLTLEGTALSTNVVQGTDNTYYRTHGFDGSTNTRIAFLDYRADIETPSTQLLVYLPTANDHAKYTELENFKHLEYYKQHPVINFNTLHENAKYKIFAVALFPKGYEGIPYQTCLDNNDKTQMVTLVQKALEHSILEIPVDVRDTDQLLTVMSEDTTLLDENGNTARVAIFARKIRAGESETVNTQKAVFKPNKHLSEAWYTQILRSQYASTVNQEIRQEAAKWFTAFELSNIADADLERQLNARKTEYGKYLTADELLLSAEEKIYLYEKRTNQTEDAPVLTLDMQNLTTRVGEESTLKAQLAPEDRAATYTWTSSNDAVLSVKGNGSSAKLTANKEGTAVITVTSGKATASCNVEVRSKKEFILNPSSMTIFVDNSYSIKASTDIQQATSSNTGVAKVTVNKNLATVYGVAPGKATITVTGKNGMYATCEVTVNQYNLTFDKTTLTMHKGNRREIHVSTGEAANWYVSNTNVIKLTEIKKGKVVLVEAIGAGNATVTATARNGAQVSCQITVDGGGVAFSTTHMDMQKGQFRELTVTRGDVARWEISDKSVAQVCIFSGGKTIEVEALGYGTATIKAYGSDGSVATLTVTVSAPKESLTITPYSMTMTKGDIRNISVTTGSATKWVSSNPNVAEVFVVGNGSMAQVEARNPGTTTITVYDSLGGWVNCNVTVEAPVEKLVLDTTHAYMVEGDWIDVLVTSGKAVDWSSTNSNVVGVYVVGSNNNTVRFKANNAGTAEVIAYAADGSTAVCYVSVNTPYVETLAVNKTSMSLTAGDMADLYVSSGRASYWTSSNPSVADVFVVGDGSMVQVEARAAGTTVLTAYADDGSTASCTVTVEAPYVPPVAEEPLTLNTKNIVVEEGDWGKIYVTGGKCTGWNTTNANIVRVYDVGDPTMIQIKGESAGTADIIAYGSDGSTITVKVTVTGYEVPVTEPVVEDTLDDWDDAWDDGWDDTWDDTWDDDWDTDWDTEDDSWLDTFDDTDYSDDYVADDYAVEEYAADDFAGDDFAGDENVGG